MTTETTSQSEEERLEELFLERAAIMEYDGELDRAEAERLARLDGRRPRCLKDRASTTRVD